MHKMKRINTLLFVSFLIFSVRPQAQTLDTSEQATEYEIQLCKYLRTIDKIAKARDADQEAQKAERRQFILSQIKKIEENETEIIQKIEEEIAKRPHKEMFRYESDYEYTLGNLFHGSSDASYRLTRHFVDRGKLKNKEIIIKHLTMSSIPKLTPEWSELFEEALNEQPENAFWRNIGTTFIYSYGASPEKFQPAILELLDRKYAPALAALLLDYRDDPDEPDAIVNPFTHALYKKYTSPDIYCDLRLVAAYYAWRIHDYETALQTYLSISQQDYIGIPSDSGHVIREPDADIDLWHAKETAQDMLFYTIKGEKSFNAIWKNAHQLSPESDTPANGKIINKDRYDYYIRETHHAQELLKTLSNYKE
jgi:hypothetical protein